MASPPVKHAASPISLRAGTSFFPISRWMVTDVEGRIHYPTPEQIRRLVVYKKIVSLPREGTTLQDWLGGLFDVGVLPKDALWLDAAISDDPADDQCVITFFSAAQR